jgi:hypothetical protein
MERRDAFKASMENMEWLTENYDSLKHKFDGKWIAIADGQVIKTAEDLRELAEAIKSHEKRESIVIEHIRAEPIAMFF